jgi:NADH-quinone oxidoreductase subunit M
LVDVGIYNKEKNMEFLSNYIVTLTIFFPLLTSILVCFSPNLPLAKLVGLAGSMVTFLFSLHLWYHFDVTTPDLQFVERYQWLPEFGVSYFVGVDGLSLLLILLTTFLTPLLLISVWHLQEARQKGFIALLMALECGMVGALVAFDLVLFYIFWEVMLIPMYFIIGIWGGANRIYATTKFVIYTVFGSLLMLVAAVVLYLYHAEATGLYSTSLLDLYSLAAKPLPGELFLFAAFMLAFAIKIPMWPFHTWLPDAHTEAPTAGSVILAGVLLKMGTYGLLRFAIPLFPHAVEQCAPLLLGLGVVGIIYGALTAWVQADAKKMVAYSSVSHLGFVIIGSLALVGTQLSEEALTGAVYQMINHGLSTGALFFLVGMIYERRHSRMLDDFGGLAAVMPYFALMLIVATLSSVGLPGTGGFVGEFLILLGVFQAKPLVAVLATSGVILGALYMLTLCRKILFGPLSHEENKKLTDMVPREFLYITPLILLSVIMGVFPELFLAKIRTSVSHLAQHYQSYHLKVQGEDIQVGAWEIKE